MGRFKCLVPDCKSFNKDMPNLSYFCLPKNFILCKQWSDNLCLTEFLADKPNSQTHHYRICSLHFEDTCFQNSEKKKLNRGAVPTILRIDTSNKPEICEATTSQPNTATVFNNIEYLSTPAPGSSSSPTIFPTLPTISRNIKGRKPFNILKQVGETRVRNLSPKERKLYGEIVKARHIISSMRKRGTPSLEKVLKNMDVPTADMFRDIKKISNMPPIMQMFIKSMIRNYAKKPMARRYSVEEKSFFVALLKSSPRGYHHLSRFLPMPAKRTLNRSLANVELRSGINFKLFSYLNTASADLDPLDRHCILMFDEVSLRPHLAYGKGSDEVEGLEEVAGERSYRLADHALVFMIRGLRKSWKQPLAFFFVQSTAKTYALKSCIQQVVRAVHEQTKFVIVASVSDMGSSNRAAVNSLGKDHGRPYIYNVDGHEIIHIFDPPHLIKCVRNNFMAKNIVYSGEKTAKWEHIKSLYEIDGTTEDSKITKLTNNHINPEGKKKMKVSLAVQVFSRSVYAVLTMLTKSGGLAAQDTANFCLFMNNLFDSLNSTAISPRPYACRVDDNSVHHQFWTEARTMLDGIVFIGNKPGPVPPCINFLKVTILNVGHLWKTLKNIGFKYMLTKAINQDPLENFFAVIRGLCALKKILL